MEDVRIPIPEILHFSYLPHFDIHCYSCGQKNADHEFEILCSREKLLLTKPLL